MKDAETKRRCIELRAHGKSLNTIAEEVGVRRQTVANWLRELRVEVEHQSAIQLDALREASLMSKQQRIECLRTRLEHITAELDKRDFSDVPTAKLVDLERKTRAELANEFSDDDVIRSEEELVAAKNPDPNSIEGLISWDRPVPSEVQVAPLLEPEIEGPTAEGNGRKRSRGRVKR